LEEVARLHRSLYDWAFEDIRRSAESVPRLAFVGLSAWIDTLAFLVAGKKSGEERWTTLFRAYLPEYLAHDGARRLYVGLRCHLLHQYGPLEILTHVRPAAQLEPWLFPDGNLLSLPKLLDDFDALYTRFRASVESDERLRSGVLLRGRPLLQEIEIRSEPALSASASSTTTLARVTPTPPDLPF
jgi:hypothetical protein